MTQCVASLRKSNKQLKIRANLFFLHIIQSTWFWVARVWWVSHLISQKPNTHAVLIKPPKKVINKQGNYHDTVNANSFYPIRVQYSIGLKLGHIFLLFFFTAVAHALITQGCNCQCNHTLPRNLHQNTADYFKIYIGYGKGNSFNKAGV